MLAAAVLFTLSATAAKLSDYSPYNYEVYFTNPVCETYEYENPVEANDGSLLYAKPQNAYCKREDFAKNAVRLNSPHYNILKLVKDKKVTKLFLAFLSFSNDDVANEICDAVKRNVEVTFIIDSNNISRPSARQALDKVSECRPENLADGEEPNLPKVYFRGNKKGIGYAHNKVIIANYGESEEVKLVYGSGNMSSGTILHHENWHFVTTNKNTFLYQSHLCLKKAMIESGDSKAEYKKKFKTCRSEIQTEEEEDIQMMVVPSDGKRAAQNIVDNFKKAESIDVAVHRFTLNELIDSMREASKADKRVRFIADDDIYWTGKRRTRTGSNMYFEFVNVMKIFGAGVDIRYIQSNQNHSLLHHNKYIVFNYEDGTGAVHAGAGNFTGAAFSKNMENYYFISIDSVVEKFRKQYDYMFNTIGTSYEKMPSEYVMP